MLIFPREVHNFFLFVSKTKKEIGLSQNYEKMHTTRLESDRNLLLSLLVYFFFFGLGSSLFQSFGEKYQLRFRLRWISKCELCSACLLKINHSGPSY